MIPATTQNVWTRKVGFWTGLQIMVVEAMVALWEG